LPQPRTSWKLRTSAEGSFGEFITKIDNKNTTILPNIRMVSPRAYFARMNENREDNSWLTEAQLMRGTEEFFKSNDYTDVEYNKTLDQGGRTFSSPIVASKRTNDEGESEKEIENEMIVTIFKSKIKHYDLSFFGLVESLTLDVLDNYEQTNLMLVTDSLSYFPILKNEQISVEIENMMRDGLFVLFLNHRFTYALFDRYENMTKPIPIYD
jgi:hypothetical protein